MSRLQYLREVSAKIFPLRTEEINLRSILGGTVVILAIAAPFVGGLDLLVGWISRSLQPTSPHYVADILCAIALFAALYLFLFFCYAPEIAISHRLEDQERINGLMLDLQGLQNDKQQLVRGSDYRQQLAAAVGVKLLSVKRDCEIRTLNGDCTLNDHQQFVVSGISLGDLVRRQSSQCLFLSKTPPTVYLTGLPSQESTYETKFEEKNGVHEIHIFFRPPLERTNPEIPVNLFISEEAEQGFLMAREQIPRNWTRTGCQESIGHLIAEPTERLEVSIKFPLGYTFPQTDVSLRVTYGPCESRHTVEEERLRNVGALRVLTLPDGKLKLSMTVEKPLLGLSYRLCWLPIVQAELAELIARLTPKKGLP